MNQSSQLLIIRYRTYSETCANFVYSRNYMIPKFKLETFVYLEALWDLIPGAWDNVALPTKLDGTSSSGISCDWPRLLFFFSVQNLRREKVLRIFKLNTGQDDHAIMFFDDYLCQVCLHGFLDVFGVCFI